MSQQQAKKLLRKYLNGTATAAERQLVESWYEFRMEDGQLLLTPEEEREILERVRLKALAATPVVSLYRRKIFWRTAAAVCLVLLAGGAVFYWQREKVSTTVVARDDRRPGSNGAVLTLANGQQILLDSSTNGQVAQQGGVQVVQQDGQLTYAGQSAQVMYNTMTTPIGRTFRMVLPDGTKVWLNAGSSLTFPTAFTGRERLVSMTGEAYFEVVHNHRQPFRVHAAKALVEDVGTAFDINAYGNESALRATIVEGAVRFSTENTKAKSNMLLHQGEQAALTASGTVQRTRNVDIGDVIAWKNGNFRFSSADIYTIMRQAARWYGVEVVFEDRITATFSGGIPRYVNASQLLHILESTDKVRFEIRGKKIIVRKHVE